MHMVVFVLRLSPVSKVSTVSFTFIIFILFKTCTLNVLGFTSNVVKFIFFELLKGLAPPAHLQRACALLREPAGARARTRLAAS